MRVAYPQLQISWLAPDMNEISDFAEAINFVSRWRIRVRRQTGCSARDLQAVKRQFYGRRFVFGNSQCEVAPAANVMGTLWSLEDLYKRVICR